MRISASKLLSALVLLTGVAVLTGLGVGSGNTGFADLLALWNGQAEPAAAEVLLRLRMPRVLAAFGTGACLAIAGVLMQALLRNPLADPYILGTSGGAAVAALLVMLAGASGILVDAAAFAGALLSTLLVFGLARTGGDWSSGRLLLTGVVVAAGWSALISLLLATSAEANLRSILFWLMGDFAFAATAMGVARCWRRNSSRCRARHGPGPQPAHHRRSAGSAAGPARRADPRRSAYFLSALLTAIAVTTAGTVGFVGLVVPHLVRLVSGVDHRSLIPAAALAGGSLLVVADTLARTLLAPRQLPVGAITALVGVPLFLFSAQPRRAPRRLGAFFQVGAAALHQRHEGVAVPGCNRRADPFYRFAQYPQALPHRKDSATGSRNTGRGSPAPRGRRHPTVHRKSCWTVR